jgi:hypothetical protein
LFGKEPALRRILKLLGFTWMVASEIGSGEHEWDDIERMLESSHCLSG